MVFAGLLRREWLEHGSAFMWAPAVVLAIMLIASVSILLGGDVMTDVSNAERQELHERLGEGAQDPGAFEALAAMTLDAAGSTDKELSGKLEALQRGIAEPFRYVFVIVAFFALIGCVYDERKDRSVLFWKSMPVSDTSSVLSKIVFVLWLAPLATVAAIFLAQFASVVLSSMFVESGMGGRIWRLSGIWSNPFELLVFYGMYGLWLLPFASWAVLISSWATRLPVLLVFAVPIALSIVERLILGGSTVAYFTRSHFATFNGWRSSSNGVFDQFALLLEPTIWIGVIVAGLFLGAAVFLRKRNNEI